MSGSSDTSDAPPGGFDDLGGLGDHLVHFATDDVDLVEVVAGFAATGLRRGEGCVLVATAEHLVAIEASLGSRAVDTSTIVALDARRTLDRILDPSGDRVDPARFGAVVGRALDRAVPTRGRRVRVFGEMVALLWAEGRAPLAMELEDRWNRLGHTSSVPFTLLCGYPMPSVVDDPIAAARFFEACGHHSGVGRGDGEGCEAWRRFDDGTRDLPGVRAFVRGTLGGWGRHAVSTDAALVATELATNAIVHARTPFHVSLAPTPVGGGVRVAVHDASPVAPAWRAVDVGSTSGRGMQLLDAMASAWGVDHHAGAKTVWAELAG
jgi:hypothetical protein